MRNLNKMKNDLLNKTIESKKKAWAQKDFFKSQKIREEEQKDYEKWKLLDGIIKVNKKRRKQ